MVDRRLLFSAVLILAGLGVMGVPAVGSDLHHQALWRLEHDFVTWANLQEIGSRKVLPSGMPGTSRERFLSRLEAIERGVRALDEGSASDLHRKVRAIRFRIVSWPGPADPARKAERSVRFPLSGKPVRVRPAVPSANCADALALSTETVFWATADHTRIGSAKPVAWFNAPDVPSGWYRIHTEGSSADTVVTVFNGCGGPVLGSNDDDVGLLSRLVVHKKPELQMVVKVEVTAFEGQQDLFLTLEGTGSGGITGTVRDESTGGPLSSVWVEAYDSDGSYRGDDYTSDSGLYSIVGLEPDSYFLLTDNTEDYLDELWDDIPCEPECDPTNGDAIPVDQATVTGIDFDLSPGASLSGTVFEIDGGLVTEGSVRLHNNTGQEVDHDYLDELGRFRFQGLEGGVYYLRTSLENHLDELWDDIPCTYSCEPLSGTPIQLEELESASGFDFYVQRLGTISGRLTDARTGLPIIYRSVIVDSLDSGGDYAQSDALGNWTSRGLFPGVYFGYSNLYSQYRNEVYDDIPCDPWCDYDQGTPIALGVDENVAGIDLALDPLGAISGVVSDASTGLPVAGVWVEVWNSSGEDVEGGSSSAVGNFEVLDLHPDTYFAVTDEENAFVDELFDNIPCFMGPPWGCDPLAGTPIPIDLGDSQGGIDFSLARGGILSGQLRDAATGEPVQDAEVQIFVSTGALVTEVDADSQGTFVADGLVAESYFVLTDSETHLDELWKGFDCEGGCDPAAGTPVPVRLGQLVGDLDFDLVLQGGLSGVVTDEEAPILGLVIHAWNSQGEAIAAAVTDSNGFYQIDLSSGIYYLSTDAPEGYVNEIWFEVSCPSGPAIEDLCDPLEGEGITVVGADPVQAGYDFALDEILFSDGFESGDLSEWSEVVH